MHDVLERGRERNLTADGRRKRNGCVATGRSLGIVALPFGHFGRVLIESVQKIFERHDIFFCRSEGVVGLFCFDGERQTDALLA